MHERRCIKRGRVGLENDDERGKSREESAIASSRGEDISDDGAFLASEREASVRSLESRVTV